MHLASASVGSGDGSGCVWLCSSSSTAVVLERYAIKLYMDIYILSRVKPLCAELKVSERSNKQGN